MKDGVEKFDISIQEVIGLLEKDEEKARELFKNKKFDEFYHLVWSDTHPLKNVRIFYLDLFEYLRNEGVKATGMVKKRDILDAFNSSYKEELKESYKLEKTSK